MPILREQIQDFLAVLGVKAQKAPNAIGFSICRLPENQHPKARQVTIIKSDDVARVTSQLRRLHLGCGSLCANGYINLDLSIPEGIIESPAQQGAQDCYFYQSEINGDLQLGSGSLQEIYMSHFLEHLDYVQVNGLLRRCAEALQPGGCLRIAVPDFRLWCRKYLQRSKAFFRWYSGSFLCNHWDPVETPCTTFNGLIYGHGHQSMFDFETLEAKLLQAGFSHVSRKQWGQSKTIFNIAQLEAPDSIRRHESLIVEATR